MNKKENPPKLSKNVQKILVSLAEALIVEPDDLEIFQKEEEMLRRCELLMREMPGYFRFMLNLAFFFFNNMTVLFGFGIRDFTSLPLEAKRIYTDRWLKTKITVLREIFKALRGLVMMTYFSHPDVWRYIGYDPAGHVKERLALRAKLLQGQMKINL